MKRALIIWGRELGAAFSSPVAYVTISLFVVSQAGLFYLLGYPVGPVPLPSFWEGGQADLLALFAWQPLLLALLVPALTMGAWADERRGGTEELLLSYPLHSGEAVLGKFLAAWSLVIVLLVASVVPVAVTVAGLGDLDLSTVWVGLVGGALLGAGYVALALCCSAATTEQLVAFLLGALVLGLLWVLRLLVPALPPGLAAGLDYACPSSHFLESAARGVLDLRDVIYFASLTLFGLVLNTVLVERRRWSV